MNLFNFIARGTAGAKPYKNTAQRRVDDATEQARENWIHKLQVDEMRAWCDLGEAQTSTLNGLSTMLTIAGLAQAYSDKSIETRGVRVIRSAMNVIRGCLDHGAVITEVDIVTLQVACREAKDIIRKAPPQAIHYAAINMSQIAKELPV